jgi:peptide/nickel transport system substrate-binding protein
MDTPAPDVRIFRASPAASCRALNEPSSNVPFIMPRLKRPSVRRIDDYVGSGPYVFRATNSSRRARRYLKNPKYVPRKESPSGTAGGKRVYVERIEWVLAARDPQTQVNALQKGEIDMIERVPFEQIGALRADKGVDLVIKDPSGFQYVGRFNHLHPPFDKPAVRRAAIAAFGNQEAFLKAQIGVKELYKTCPSMFVCGTAYASGAGTDIQQKANLKKAQELLKASGYDGSTVLIMKPTDINTINKLPEVGASFCSRPVSRSTSGVDWQTLVAAARRTRPTKEGWSLSLPRSRAGRVERFPQHRQRRVAAVRLGVRRRLKSCRQLHRATDEAVKKSLPSNQARVRDWNACAARRATSPTAVRRHQGAGDRRDDFCGTSQE